MMHQLGETSLVAEGVETEAQQEMLHSMGSDVGQGYFYSRPVPEEDFLAQLEEEKAAN